MAEGLERFEAAQDEGGTYERAMAEVAAGAKRGHWMWFVYPQLAGLGQSPTARFYAIRDEAEARALLAHPVLGPRLRRAMRTAADAPARSAEALLGGIDAVKLRSSATLFGRVAPEEPVFGEVLDRWYGGEEDRATLALL
ncbi:DUF1810 domain-containing protein [Amnibacterium endophyticum]|uniref:DUF1810 domain-containing protein n=1 Tax=Amnibacterium endophyticum TaxID=2109337 RepID=A0ABW4LGM5_9MICO